MCGVGKVCPGGFKFPSGTIPRISDIWMGETSKSGSLTCAGQSGGEGGGVGVASIEAGAGDGEGEAVGLGAGIWVGVRAVRDLESDERVGLRVDSGGAASVLVAPGRLVRVGSGASVGLGPA